MDNGTAVEILFDALCCVICADARITSSERYALYSVLKRFGHSMTSEEVVRRIEAFLTRARDVSLSHLVTETAQRLARFRRSETRHQIAQALEYIANADGFLDRREVSVYLRFTEALGLGDNSKRPSTVKPDGRNRSTDLTSRLEQAVREANLTEVQRLLQQGANPNQPNHGGQVPLHIAALDGHVDIVRLLLDSGANANAVDRSNDRPIHLAAIRGSVEIVACLLQHGADPSCVSSMGSTPAQLAADAGHDDVAALLEGATLEHDDPRIDETEQHERPADEAGSSVHEKPRHPMRSRIVLLLVIAGLSVSGVALFKGRVQRKTATEIADQLETIQALIDQGILRDLDARIKQAESDLRHFKTGMFVSADSADKRDLSQQLQDLHGRYEACLKTTEDTIHRVLRALKDDDHLEAVTVARKAAQQFEDHKALTEMADCMRSLLEQDFERAEHHARRLSSWLPDNDDTGIQIEYLLREIHDEASANSDKQRRVADAVDHAFDKKDAKEARAFHPAIKGRVMVWDCSKQKVDPAYWDLPSHLRASRRDGLVTIFCVLQRRRALAGHYNFDSNQPGYQNEALVGVAYWPSKTILGTVILRQGPPRQRSAFEKGPEYAPPVDICRWILNLPRQ